MSAAPQLLADRMLGKLARILRMTGQDTEYVREGEAFRIADRAAAEQRVLLTRDQRLARRTNPGPVVFVKSNYPFHQARQVIRELGLVPSPASATAWRTTDASSQWRPRPWWTTCPPT